MSSRGNLAATPEPDGDDHWVSISDMMAGLMVIFLFIAISYMVVVKADKARIEKIAVIYQELQQGLYADLEREFAEDLERWKAVLSRETLAIRFMEPEVLFGQGAAEIRPMFGDILDEFFPRYLTILRQPVYIDDISEIRIEGHTNSDWSATVSEDDAYILNMELSQDRTRSVLDYVMGIPSVGQDTQVREWLTHYLTANGLSSSKLVLNADGAENKVASRRVEFRVRMDAESRIVEILHRRERDE